MPYKIIKIGQTGKVINLETNKSVSNDWVPLSKAQAQLKILRTVEKAQNVKIKLNNILHPNK